MNFKNLKLTDNEINLQDIKNYLKFVINKTNIDFLNELYKIGGYSLAINVDKIITPAIKDLQNVIQGFSQDGFLELEIRAISKIINKTSLKPVDRTSRPSLSLHLRRELFFVFNHLYKILEQEDMIREINKLREINKNLREEEAIKYNRLKMFLSSVIHADELNLNHPNAFYNFNDKIAKYNHLLCNYDERDKVYNDIKKLESYGIDIIKVLTDIDLLKKIFEEIKEEYSKFDN